MLSTLVTMAWPNPFAASPRSTEETKLDEATLIRKAANGDRNALETLLHAHVKTIHDVCNAVLGRQEAADACQESMERIVTMLHRFEPQQGSFRTWASAVTRNLCRDRLRHQSVVQRTFAVDEDMERRASTAPTPEDKALAVADAEQLSVALATLPEGMRTALVLFHLHEASYEEIASTLEVPMGTVMTWLHRGRKQLRAHLETNNVG